MTTEQIISHRPQRLVWFQTYFSSKVSKRHLVHSLGHMLWSCGYSTVPFYSKNKFQQYKSRLKQPGYHHLLIDFSCFRCKIVYLSCRSWIRIFGSYPPSELFQGVGVLFCFYICLFWYSRLYWFHTKLSTLLSFYGA